MLEFAESDHNLNDFSPLDLSLDHFSLSQSNRDRAKQKAEDEGHAIRKDINDRYWDYYNKWYMWTHNWHECNYLCKAYLAADAIALTTHVGVNLITLDGWADGSMVLIFNTYYTFYITFFSVMMLLGSPSMMLAPYEFRRTIFGLSTMTVSAFIGNLVSILVRYMFGTTPSDSFFEIMNMYLLLLQIGAFVPALFIFLFDGLALSPYSIFNHQYGQWDDVLLPGQREREEKDQNGKVDPDLYPDSLL